MALAANDVIEAKIFLTTTGEVAINALHYRVNAVVGASLTEQQVVDLLFTRFSTGYPPLVSSAAFYAGMTVQKIRPLPVGAAQFSSAAPVAGTVAGDLMPRQVSGIITKRSVLAGRANRGRMYVAYPSESDNGTGGAPSAGYITRLATLAGQAFVNFTLTSGANSVDLVPVVYHRILGTSNDVTTSLSRNYWATQRRRNNFY